MVESFMGLWSNGITWSLQSLDRGIFFRCAICSNCFFSSSVTYILIYIESVLSCSFSRSLFRFGGRVWAEPHKDQRARKGCFGLCLLQRMREYSDWLQVINCTDLRMWKRKNCSKILSRRERSHAEGACPWERNRGMVQFLLRRLGNECLFLSSSPSVGKLKHPSVLLSRVAGIAIVFLLLF